MTVNLLHWEGNFRQTWGALASHSIHCRLSMGLMFYNPSRHSLSPGLWLFGGKTLSSLSCGPSGLPQVLGLLASPVLVQAEGGSLSLLDSLVWSSLLHVHLCMVAPGGCQSCFSLLLGRELSTSLLIALLGPSPLPGQHVPASLRRVGAPAVLALFGSSQLCPMTSLL